MIVQRILCLLLLLLVSSSSVDIDTEHSYPKRSNVDAALLEWGSSAIIHNADGVVSKFGPSAAHPEFELGIEAELVTASPRQGCEPLSNARSVATQIVVMVRGGCTFGTKASNAAKAGAAALLVINNERRSPDRSFAMDYYAMNDISSKEVSDDHSKTRDTIDPAVTNMPSVMISYAAGQQLREHSPRRMRLFAGGGRPFIESVTDFAPVLYLVHNAITDQELDTAISYLTPALQQKAKNSAPATTIRAHRILGALRGSSLNTFYERIANIVGHPVEYLSDLVLEERVQGSPTSPVRDDLRLSRFYADTGDDLRLTTVMTIYIYVNTIQDAEYKDGGLIFPRARPYPVRISPTKGLAAIWYSAMEDGSLDRAAAHLDAALSGTNHSYRLHLRVYAQPRSIARRILLPILLLPFGPTGPNKHLVLAARRFFVRTFTELKADAAIDFALYLIFAVLLTPLAALAFFAFTVYDQSRAKPKRRSVSSKPDHPPGSKKKAPGKKA